jgi:hypothetical protein
MKKHVFTRANLSDVRVIIVIMRVPVEKSLYQVVTGLILVLECLLLGAGATYGYVPSYQALNVVVSQGPTLMALPGTEKTSFVIAGGPCACRAER